jgi:hypothetical protein
LWHVRRGGLGDAITILSGAADGCRWAAEPGMTK